MKYPNYKYKHALYTIFLHMTASCATHSKQHPSYSTVCTKAAKERDNEYHHSNNENDNGCCTKQITLHH